MADDGATTTEKKKGGGRAIQIGIVAVLMLLEGGVVYFVSRTVGGAPTGAEASEVNSGDDSPDGTVIDLVEVELAESRPSNKRTGRFVTFHLRVSGLVGADDLERTKELAEARKARILDRVNYVVRSADPAELNEAGLETLKRRLLKEFQLIFEDEDLIKQILIPELLQSGPGV